MIIITKDVKNFFFLFSGSIFSQIFNLINLSLIIKYFPKIEVADYFYLQAIIAVVVGLFFFGFDKLLLYEQKKTNIHEKNLNTHVFCVFIILLLTLIFFNKSFYFTVNIFFLCSAYYFEIINTIRKKYIYNAIYKLILPCIFFLFILQREILYLKDIDLIVIFTISNFISWLLIIFFNVNNILKVQFNFLLKRPNIKNNFKIWLSDSIPLLAFSLPTIFFKFFEAQNLLIGYNIILRFGFMPIFFINSVVSKFCDLKFNELRNKSKFFNLIKDSISKLFLFSFIYFFVFNFVIFMAANYNIIDFYNFSIYLHLFSILFLFNIVVGSLGGVFLIDKKYNELNIIVLSLLIVNILCLIIYIITNNYNNFFVYLFIFSMLRVIFIFYRLNRIVTS